MDNGRFFRLALSRQIPTFGGNEKTLNWAVEILEIQKTGLRRIWYDRWDLFSVIDTNALI